MLAPASQTYGFLGAHGAISVLVGNPGSKWSKKLVQKALERVHEDPANIRKALLHRRDKEQDKADEKSLKIVFNGQHRQQASLRVEGIEKLPCGIWCKLHPSLARWLGTKLNVVAGKQLASTTLEKYQVLPAHSCRLNDALHLPVSVHCPSRSDPTCTALLGLPSLRGSCTRRK